MYRNEYYYSTENWQTVLNRMPPTSFDVFHRYDYHKLFARIERANCEAFIYEDGKTILILPYLKRTLHEHIHGFSEEGLTDLTSVYGYSGLAGVNFDSNRVKEFVNSFDNYCKQTGLVSSFIRLHPLLSQPFLGLLPNVTQVNSVVILPLVDGLDIVEKRFKHGVRKGIRKASELGIRIEKTDKVPVTLFRNIYQETLHRNNAKSFYNFDEQFFIDMNAIEDVQTTYIAFLDKKPISVEIVLRSSQYWHSFLGGTLSGYLNSSANTLLKYQIIKDAASEGVKAFVLGGGLSAGDGIHKYKQSFSPGEDVSFNIQCNVHIDHIYRSLIDAFDTRVAMDDASSSRFQRYLES